MNKKQSQKCGDCVDDEDRKMRKLFVDKLSSDITEDDIYSVFSKHGEIEEVAKYQDRRAPTRYFAFVVYKYAKDCVKATHNPCPIIRGKKCACMLAAIGKQFSGYKFFVQKGLLTEEEKQQNAVNQCNTSNQTKKQRQRRHNKNKNKSNNIQINIPTFKEDQLSQRSGAISNSSFDDNGSPVQYMDHPSWHSYFDSRSHGSHSTVLSNLSKSVHSVHSMHSMHQTPQFTPYSQHYNGSRGGRGYQSARTPQTHRRRHTTHHHHIPITPQPQTQPQPQTHRQAQNMYEMQYYQAPSVSRGYYPQTLYSLSSQPIQPQPHPSYVVPPMTQSISYSHLERSRSNSPNYSHHPHQQAHPHPYPYQLPLPLPTMMRSALQQQSAPKLPITHHLTPPYKVKRTASNPTMFTGNSEPMRNNVVIMAPDIHADIQSPELLMDFEDDFAEMGIEIGLTPPPPLLLNAAKSSIDIDKLPVPTFCSIEDAQKASDRELEVGFTMLASPTPSVHTEYNDSEDLNAFILNDYEN